MIEIRVGDDGAWRQRRNAAGGLGLHLMERLVDDVEVVTTGAGTTVVLRMQSAPTRGSER